MNNNIRKILVCGFLLSTSILLVYCSHKSVTDRKVIEYKEEFNYKAVMYNNEFEYEPEPTIEKQVIKTEPVKVEKQKRVAKKEEPKNENVYDLSKSDINLLEHLVMGEAEGESFEGKIAVAQIALNRMKIREKTLEDVIYEKSQFTCVNDGRFNLTPTDECIEAVKKFLSGSKTDGITDDTTYFTAGYSRWHDNNLDYVTKIGGHRFYREKNKEK